MDTVPNLVSIIVPVYNRGTMLREAVASALEQNYRPIEIIIVDDGSTDDTTGIIEDLVARHREIKGLRCPNGGPGLAREAGRMVARGEYIQYLDSDDLLLPRKLELQVAALEDDASAGIAYGKTRYIGTDGEELVCNWKNANQVQRTIFPSFLAARWWETATPLYRRTITDAAGPWTDLRLEEDWEYDARIGALGQHLVFIEDFVAAHRDHREGRLSRGPTLDPRRLRDRARAHELIYRHARRAGIGDDVPEMKHFARELFLLARQSGAAGLRDESKVLFELAREASGTDRDRVTLRLYSVGARILGWQLAGKLACFSDRWRW